MPLVELSGPKFIDVHRQALSHTTRGRRRNALTRERFGDPRDVSLRNTLDVGLGDEGVHILGSALVTADDVHR